MNKKGLLLLGMMLIIGVLLVSTKGNEVDWSPTFDDTGENPMDTKILYDQMPFLFPGKAAKKVHTTFYEYDRFLSGQGADTLANYISISNHLTMDAPSFEALLEYVSYGNNAFISAHTFPHYVKEALQFETVYHPLQLEEHSCKVDLVFSGAQIDFDSKLDRGFTSIKDTTLFKKLGHVTLPEGDRHINFIGIPVGNGIFYIHTSPETFTNYQLLHAKDMGYVNTALSYLPDAPMLINKVVKANAEMDRSPLRYIASQPALKWGWYLLLLGIGLFIIFNAKRRQRIIPIRLPLKNTTTEFVHTVSNLHYEAADYNGIVQKMIVHFLEDIRSMYHLRTDTLDDGFIKKLALKSGKPIGEVQSLVHLIAKMKNHHFNTKEPLLKLNEEIEKFYQKDTIAYGKQ